MAFISGVLMGGLFLCFFRTVFILWLFFSCFRRLNTLNKCASMKLDVNLPKKKVSVNTKLQSLH